MVTGISLIGLLLMYSGTRALQNHSSEMIAEQLPFTLMLNNLSSKVTESIEVLNTFVLLSDKQQLAKRAELWKNDIFPLLAEITEHIETRQNPIKLASLSALSDRLKKLYVSQWWAEDVSQYIGNQPSLVIYQRDILPLYYRIQSALKGVHSPIQDHSQTNELRLVVSHTHLTLSETIHQLSEAILTGDLAYLTRFQLGSKKVQEQIAELKQFGSLNEDAKTLVDWIDGQYGIYVKYADKVLQMRQASDWNKGFYIIEMETEVLANDVKKMIIALQNEQIKNLEKNAKFAENASHLASIYALILILVCAITAASLTIFNSRRIVRQISQLKEAAQNIAQGKLDVIDVTYHDELGDLAKVFNKMQRTILRRRKKFVRERERLNDVVHVITHDIKSPLININGHADLLCQSISASVDKADLSMAHLSEMRESIEHIHSSTDRIDELIEGILELSSVVHKELNTKPLLFKNIIQDLLKINSHRLKTADVQLKSIPDTLLSDEFAIKFVVSTLLDNAIKYKEPLRALEIEISYQYDSAQQLSRMSIKDNGIGVDEQEGKSVFTMFSQGQEMSEGFGIGLACARSFAERLNGDLYYENNQHGVGVTFHFEFSTPS